MQHGGRHPRNLVNGREAENRARRYLEKKGLSLVETNYRCQVGEIDLIMRDGSMIIFVEVRYRKDHRYESIDSRKQRKLRAAAEHYLQNRRGAANAPCRIDVVLVSGPMDDGNPQIDWIPDAM